jgi:hypothetical protein
MRFSPAGYSLPHSRQRGCFTGTIPFQPCQMFSACPDGGGNMHEKTPASESGWRAQPAGSAGGYLAGVDQRGRSLPKKPTATVPGPQCAPMTGPT